MSENSELSTEKNTLNPIDAAIDIAKWSNEAILNAVASHQPLAENFRTVGVFASRGVDILK